MATAKCEQMLNIPLQPRLTRELQTVYMIKGIAATTAIEGNPLTEEQVQALLEENEKLPSSQEYLEQEIRNMEKLFDLVWDNPVDKLTKHSLDEFNRIILNDLPLEGWVNPGNIRDRDVSVAGYRCPKPTDCEILLDKFCEWYESFDTPFALSEISKAIIKAILSHLYFVWVHPYSDGNGRTARIIELKTLFKAGLPAPAAHLLSTYYNFTRSAYYLKLHLSSKNSDCIEFLMYGVNGLVDFLDEQFKWINMQQLDVAWADFVYEQFKGRNSASDVRRRELVLDLPPSDKAISKAEIVDLTPRVTKAYATKTTKTLSRDLGVLEEMGLIRRSKKGYFSNQNRIMFQFLPQTHNEDE